LVSPGPQPTPAATTQLAEADQQAEKQLAATAAAAAPLVGASLADLLAGRGAAAGRRRLVAEGSTPDQADALLDSIAAASAAPCAQDHVLFCWGPIFLHG
jgi:hypothetical protein